MAYRRLTTDEIKGLEARGCTARDWNNVLVGAGFRCDCLEGVHFSGEVRLGRFRHVFNLAGGLERPAGLRNVTLHNCTVGNDVLIENVSDYIANYDIGDRCLIRNLDLMVTEGRSGFGNGTPAAVLNETGGREVPIFNGLSVHLAYIMALYRHRPSLIARLEELVRRYVQDISSDRGKVGTGCTITNTSTVRNVCIGPHCVIEGASRLENGTVNSCAGAPVRIGQNVIAEDFVISSGAKLTDGVALVRCFVGQATELGHLFSAHDSLFFSNCHCQNGEVCSVFAGPYTVTMHKSSLLIACMTSFLNAGSGSNQSNHLYKSGPIHQGIIERGTKTTSNSYILWPARVGAFSLIMGRHVAHTDTSSFPFSYLLERNNQTYLVPGVNLKSIGTVRDARKWPERDRRTGPELLDCLNFNLLSPYTVQKMLEGRKILMDLQEMSGETTEEYTYQRLHITNDALRKGIGYYTMAVHKFLGNSIIKRLEGPDFGSEREIRERLAPDCPEGTGRWIDLGGMIVPQEEISSLLQEIEGGAVSSLEETGTRLRRLHAAYYRMEWTWARPLIGEWYGIALDRVGAADIRRIVELWKDAVTTIDRMLYEDTKKEFSMAARTGYGTDGGPEDRERDFGQVRGDFENNPFVRMVVRHMEEKTALGDELLERLERIPVQNP